MVIYGKMIPRIPLAPLSELAEGFESLELTVFPLGEKWVDLGDCGTELMLKWSGWI